MDKGTCKSGATTKVKTPPAPKPKPPKLSTTTSNKIDSEPNSSSTPSKRVNPNNRNNRGPNINRISKVFEDSDIKSRTAPSLPLSPKLPVPRVVKPYSPKKQSQSTMNSEPNSAIDESSIAFGEIKAKFQKDIGNRATPPIEKQPAHSDNHSVTKSLDKQKMIVNSSKRTGNINKSIKKSERPSFDSVIVFNDNEADLINASFKWAEATGNGNDDVPELPRKAGRSTGSLSHKGDSSGSNKKGPTKMGRSDSYSGTRSKTDSSISTAESDFEAKRASIANLLSKTPSLMRPQGLHIETSKELPSELVRSPSQHSQHSQHSPSIKLLGSPLSDISRRSRSETSLPSFPSETAVEEEDELSVDLKRRRKLWNVIKELVETEKIFLTDMELLEEVYYIQAQEIPIFQPYDCKTIFINLPEVIDFSADFLNLLTASAGIDDLDDVDNDKHLELENDDTSIGEAFAQMMRKHGEYSRMEEVYGEYCKRHEASVQKLQEFDNDEIVQGFLQKCKSQCEGRTRSWDIASLLIKPVQRVLKYPLLLQQILSLTKPSHPDHAMLQRSFKEVTSVAERINDIKKRKDIVEKIVGNKKRTEADIKHATGIAKATEDDLYKLYLETFKNMEQRGKRLSQDIKEWIKSVKDQQRFAAAIEEYFSLKAASTKNVDLKKITEYKNAVSALANSCGKEMVCRDLFDEISIMRKRERKVLDFDRANAIKDRGAVPDKALQQSADAYVSISVQLREELPEFFRLMTQYFDIIVQEFVKIQARFYQQMLMDFRQYYYKFVDSQALELISDNRELVLRDFDIVTEYSKYYHGDLGMDDELACLVLINSGSDRLSWHSNISSDKTLRESFGFDPINYEFQSDSHYEDFRAIMQKQQRRVGAHKKYATDSALDKPQKLVEDDEDDDDDVFHDTLTGEEDDGTLFLVQTIYKNKSKQPNELNFERGALLKITHVEEAGNWWYAENADNGKKGWVDPAFVERIG
ncbi:10568_t:CDS:10 [Acaulospora colombiana]|uniref:10568_t:CDS:1 n=1 Tax=Acaulospora colombiana TaxID=27376 RepID=A0ACA9K5C7_9GLOM|nr:10568_t:CDS:10 [Acaulospora colombiana]